MQIEKFICFGTDEESRKRLIEKFKKNLCIFSWFVNCKKIYIYIYCFLPAFPATGEKCVKILSVHSREKEKRKIERNSVTRLAQHESVKITL